MQEWSLRILLEAHKWQHNTFVTLTYDPDNLPGKERWPGGTLVKKHAQNFMRYFRREYEGMFGPRKIRYFMVGEYGEKSERAHYHAILFNVENEKCKHVLPRAWSRGFTMSSHMVPSQARYVARYTVKKLTAASERKHYADGKESLSSAAWLDGRSPEFSLMSRKPGIGFWMVPILAHRLNKHGITFSSPPGIVIANMKGLDPSCDGVLRLHGTTYPLSPDFKRRIMREQIEYSNMDQKQRDSFDASVKAMEESLRIQKFEMLRDEGLTLQVIFDEVQAQISAQEAAEKRTRTWRKKTRQPV